MTLCRAAGISEEVHDALTGHVSSSVSRRYGDMPIGPLVQAIHAIKSARCAPAHRRLKGTIMTDNMNPP